MRLLARKLKTFALKMLPHGVLNRLKLHHYARKLRHVSETSEPEFQILNLLVHPGDVVVDIGANFGAYTKYLSDLVGLRGRVYSFEPIPLTFQILTSNIRKLSLDNVTAQRFAISDRDGSTTMEVPLYSTGGENYYMARVTESPSPSNLRTAAVDTRTLDSVFNSSQPAVSFIKCDAEGHELACIQGALRLTADSRPAWLIEVSGNPDHENTAASEVFRALLQAGYGAYCQSGNTLKPRRPGDRSVNYFFLTDKHVSELRMTGVIAPEVP